MNSKLAISIAIVLLLPAQLQAQKQSRTLTGRGALNEEQIAWESVKKISFFPEEIPKLVPTPSPAFDPDTVPIGAESRFDCWKFRVSQIIDGQNCIVMLGRRTFWMANYPTKHLADDEAFHVVGPVKMLESKQYNTVAGSTKTVRVFSVMSPENMRDERAKTYAERLEVIELKDGTSITVCAVGQGKGVFTVVDKSGDLTELALKDLPPDSVTKLKKQLKPQQKSKSK